ncbi:Arylsulfatase G [Cryptotermes secundus]|uniref:Arylsulfatase G n=1 Tax=Cryptotermes secundus TaxID=105785 RepID=A0A2J7RSK0_9NEOP|nr:arylsulfatase G [Cryptotermes secundus]PNF43815.1 Arylsulfatase G [Cryptotermes secundus]
MIILWSGVCVSLKMLILVYAAETDLRPNIVIIMADDMGWGDIGANWPETVDTPNIDSLAREGLRLTDFHAGASVCTPSRAALLTGRLGLRTGLTKNFGPDSLGGIPTNETTIAEILSSAGYRTAMLGKWHLGTRPGHHPLDKGFHSYLGVPYSVDMGCADPPGMNFPLCPGCPEDNSVYHCASALSNCIMDPALPLYSNRSIAHQPVKLADLATMYAEFASNFIRSTSSVPYFLYAALSHMHVPLAHGHRYDNVTRRGEYADTLRELDGLVASILSAVKQTNNNTLFWFTTDNGPWEEKCGLSGSVGPFIGMWQASPMGGGGGAVAKKTIWEAGHRVPSIIYWPEHTEAGTVSNALTSSLDILPTLAMLAGVKIPGDRYFDGVDMTSVITGSAHSIREVLFHPHSGNGKEGEIGAVRIGSYKVVYYTGGVPDCFGHSGPAQSHADSPLVFKLDVDPSESSPLEHNSSEYVVATELARMALRSLQDSIRADNTSTVDYSRSHDGWVCCNKNSPICRCPWD